MLSSNAHSQTLPARAQVPIEPLIDALRNPRDARARRHAAIQLGQVGTLQAVDVLIPALQDRDEGVCVAVIASLARIGDPRAAIPLCALLINGHPCLHPHVAQALGAIGDPQAVDALLGVLQGTGYQARIAAIEALAKIGDPRAMGPLVAALEDGDSSIRLAAAAALCTLGRC